MTRGAARPAPTPVPGGAECRRWQAVTLRQVFARRWRLLPLPQRSQRPDASLRMPRPSRRAWTSQNNLRVQPEPRRPMRSRCAGPVRAPAQKPSAQRPGPAGLHRDRARCRRASRLRLAPHGGRRRRRQETAMRRWRRRRAASRRRRCRRGWQVRPWWMAPFLDADDVRLPPPPRRGRSVTDRRRRRNRNRK
jgi:hypothetical protein